ncbi:MAG: hypothetical protein C0506_16355 [Anaerolinea sp.]|nr:hypothetical protein [Anaerolinea sp.]
MDAEGRAYCWGAGDLGQLGNAVLFSIPAVPVTGGLTFREVHLSPNGFVCGLTTLEAVYCWGNNFRGYLGTGDCISAAYPRRVLGGIAFRGITTGGAAACGTATNERVWCWGYGSSGELGRAPNIGSSNGPVEVVIP